MKRSVCFLIAGALLAAAGICWCFLRDTEEKKIRKCVTRLCRIAEYREGENPALAALRISRLEELFCDPVQLEFRHRFWEDRAVRPKELSARLAAAQRLLKTLDLRISGLQISIQQDRAELFFAAELRGRSRNGNEDFQEVRDIAAVMQRCDGLWKFQEMRVHEVLER